MAYDTNSLNICIPRLGSADGTDPNAGEGSALFMYRSDDPKATVDGAGYIDDGNDKGIQVGDIVIVADNGALATLSIVTVVDAAGDVTML